jgi:lipopolysaccharide/colanic/teichoic acid biosynthesis glycosyltransferase
VKRVADVVMSGVGLLALSPILLAVAALVKLDSPGPVFYRGVRVGRGGRPFRMFKFRTMVVNADRLGGPSAAAGDPRITRVGRWLRRLKLDELPQLLNVLTGDMSVVGPRPEVPQYVAMFTEGERRILSVRPGITDLATLWNSDEGAVRAGSDDPEKVYLAKIRPVKVRLQLQYVDTASTWLDLKIIALTLAAIVFRRKPAAQQTMVP